MAERHFDMVDVKFVAARGRIVRRELDEYGEERISVLGEVFEDPSRKLEIVCKFLETPPKEPVALVITAYFERRA